MTSLFLSPHSDDAVLFGAYTLQIERPLVLTVTDSFIQANRGENITPLQRREEDLKAMKILNCPIMFGGVRDDIIDDWAVTNLLNRFHNFDKVYAPAVQGGNAHHDLIGNIAKKLFPHVIHYTTYTPTDLYTTGTIEVLGDLKLKKKALLCYKSQLTLAATKPHFDAIEGKSEWYI